MLLCKFEPNCLNIMCNGTKNLNELKHLIRSFMIFSYFYINLSLYDLHNFRGRDSAKWFIYLHTVL